MSALRPLTPAIALGQRALDVALIVADLYVITKALDQDWSSRQTTAAATAAVLFLVFGEVQHLYGSWRLRSMDEEFGAAFVTWGSVCAVLVIAAFLVKESSSFSRAAVVTWFFTTPALLIFPRYGVRVLLRWARSHGANSRTVAIAGSGTLAQTIIEQLEQTESFGVSLVGVYDDRDEARLLKEDAFVGPMVGSFDKLVEDARAGAVDYVFIALPQIAQKRIVELVGRLADTTASVYVIPDLFVFDLMRARWTTLGNLAAVSVYESPFDGLNGMLKRLEDVVLGMAFLAIAAVPMLVIAAAIKLSGAGSVLFRQKRYGLNGRLVEVVKFRTMKASDDGEKVPQAKKDDARITPLGRFLRATSLDELPQLFNVLSGEMSLVGPRPHAVAHNEEYRRLIHGYMLRHKVKPGITGWAQVNGWRGETDTVEKMQKRVAHDLEYLQNWSLFLDFKILAMTVAAVFSRTNAY